VASNVCKWVPINLGKEIKNGLISKIPSIHRITIDYATKNSIKKKNRIVRKNGELEIKMPEQKPKRKKISQPAQRPLTVEEKNAKRINKLRERYCLNCTNTQNSSPDALMRGECPLYARKCVVVANAKLKNPIRYTISVDGESQVDKARNEFYQSHEKIDGDKFIYCASCPEMVAVISSMGNKK
jgi:hypothetical protein